MSSLSVRQHIYILFIEGLGFNDHRIDVNSVAFEKSLQANGFSDLRFIDLVKKLAQDLASGQLSPDDEYKLLQNMASDLQEIKQFIKTHPTTSVQRHPFNNADALIQQQLNTLFQLYCKESFATILNAASNIKDKTALTALGREIDQINQSNTDRIPDKAEKILKAVAKYHHRAWVPFLFSTLKKEFVDPTKSDPLTSAIYVFTNKITIHTRQHLEMQDKFFAEKLYSGKFGTN